MGGFYHKLIPYYSKYVTYDIGTNIHVCTCANLQCMYTCTRYVLYGRNKNIRQIASCSCLVRFQFGKSALLHNTKVVANGLILNFEFLVVGKLLLGKVLINYSSLK